MMPDTEHRPRPAKVAVLIPALDEEASLPLVLGAIPPDLADEVIVANNGSRDNTAAVARTAGARVVDEPRRGYGSACLAGIAALPENVGVVVFLDADYSDYPEEMSLLITPILEDCADLVIGSRMLGGRGRKVLFPQAYWGNKLAVFLIRWLWGFRYTDLGPFRAIRRTSMEALGMRDRNFGWTVEMQIRAIQHGLRIEERPVRYRRRVGVSKISGTVSGTIKAGWKILYTIFRLRFGR